MSNVISVIERVAAAMCNVAHEGDDGAARDWNSNQETYRHMAHAAIEAMREPTEEMLDVGHIHAGTVDDAYVCFTVMIDAALKTSGADHG